jgi:hypothetical protein
MKQSTLTVLVPQHVRRKLTDYLATQELITGIRPTVRSVVLDALEVYLRAEAERMDSGQTRGAADR